MSLADDWITGLGGPNSPGNDLDGHLGYPAIGLTAQNPIEGDFSLAMAGSGSSGGGSFISNSTAGWAIRDTAPKGFSSGRIRCFINPVASFPANHGVFAMATSTDLSVGSGMQGYAVILDSILGNNKAQMVYMTDGSSPSVGGSSGSTYVNLGETSNGVWSLDSPAIIELEWHVDAARLNGVHLIGRFASSTEGSPTTFAEVVHVGTPAILGPSQGEGVFCNKSTNTMAVLFDCIKVYEMPEI